MIQNFVFKEKAMQKKDFYPFICSLLEEHGWVKLSKGRVADNEVYKSTGTSGKDNIIFQMQNYYSTAKTSTIENSNLSTFGIRPIHTYTPHANLTSAGTVVPNSPHNWFYLFYNNFPLEGKINVGYHCNADRLMVVVTLDPAISGKSSVMAVGKLNPLIETNEYNHTTLVTVPTYQQSAARAASLPNYDHSTVADLTFQTNFSGLAPKALSGGAVRHATEIIMFSSILGAYAKLDNIVNLPNSVITSTLNNDISKDTLKDAEGYIWRLCASQTVYNGFPTNYFAYRIG